MAFTKPKGTRDILPPDSVAWSFVEQTARNVANEYNAQFVKTPTFESTDLFARSVGESSDIVNKEMYTFLDKSKRSMTLRPEMTAGVVRACIEQGLFNGVLPVKLCYIGNMFRYENVQAGRYREFWQFGYECFGAGGAIADLESIKLAYEFLTRVGVTGDFVLVINTLGCPDCRKKYNEALREFLTKNIDKMCADCKTRLAKNPLRALDCKDDNCQKIIKNAPVIWNYLCEQDKADFSALQKLLKQEGVKFKTDSKLVRGLDYYTQTVYELVVDNYNGTGKALTIAAGGRYDKLVEELGGKPTQAVGFGIGLDRVVSLIGECESGLDVYVANAGSVEVSQLLDIVKEVRGLGLSCEYNIADKGIKQQFKLADKANTGHMIIVGDKELASSSVTLKNMKGGEEQLIKLTELTTFLTKKKQ